jgi:integrase
MIKLQLCTVARPGEVCIIRPCDIDMSGPLWEYVPKSHKTEHHSRKRLIAIGQRGQEILKPYLANCKSDQYLFRPDESENARNKLRRASRQSPMTPSQSQRKRTEAPKRPPGDRYWRQSYTKAIARACVQAKVPVWSPNQLRHNAATEIRKLYGLDAARTVSGHTSAAVTEIYAEQDFDKARKIMLEWG